MCARQAQFLPVRVCTSMFGRGQAVLIKDSDTSVVNVTAGCIQARSLSEVEKRVLPLSELDLMPRMASRSPCLMQRSGSARLQAVIFLGKGPMGKALSLCGTVLV